MKPLLLLDLDNTMFRTADFWSDFAVALARAINKPDITFLEDYDAFTIGEGKLRFTDYDRILSNVNITDDQVREYLLPLVVGKSFLFDDAIALLSELPLIVQNYEVRIVTFGQQSFQQLKLDFAPELKDIEADIIQDVKARYISTVFANRTGVLVDDKPKQELPPGWTELHIDRTLAEYSPPIGEATGIIKITSLADVPKLI